MIISSCWRARAARKRSFPATGTCTTSWIRYRQCCCLALSSVVSRRNQRRFVSPRWLQAGPIDAHEARRGLRRELPPGRPGHTCSCALRWPRRLLHPPQLPTVAPPVERGRAMLEEKPLQRAFHPLRNTVQGSPAVGSPCGERTGNCWSPDLTHREHTSARPPRARVRSLRHARLMDLAARLRYRFVRSDVGGRPGLP